MTGIHIGTLSQRPLQGYSKSDLGVLSRVPLLRRVYHNIHPLVGAAKFIQDESFSFWKMILLQKDGDVQSILCVPLRIFISTIYAVIQFTTLSKRSIQSMTN